MSGALDVVRPFAWLAVIAFLVGFVSYLAFGEASTAQAKAVFQPAAYSEPAGSGPLSDDWNTSRQI